jgi:hypothetical protein
MEPFGALLVAAVGAAVAILTRAWQNERREESWTRVAEDLGLASRSWRRSWLGPSGLSGTTPEGAVVEIAERGTGNARRTELSVGVPGQIPAWVHLTDENFGTAFSRAFGERDLEVGDPAFDAEVAVHGDAPSAVAALTQEARLAARALVRDDFEVHGGTVHFTFRRGARDAAEIVVAARRAIWLAGLLASTETIPRRLAAQASGDPVPGVRRRALERLADGFAELPETAAALTAALGRAGTTAAVAPLRAVVAAHPLDLGLRGSASEAIAAIQARADGAAPGQLALAGGEAGALAIADAATGRVALADQSGSDAGTAGGDDR